MGEFDYRVLYRLNQPDQISTVFAWRNLIGSPLEAVMWHGKRRQWICAGPILVREIFDDLNQERSGRVDRPTAEQLCRQTLGTELPSEAELDRICLAKSPSWDDPQPTT